MKCPMCDNELTGRQTYCSPACRKKASRLADSPPKNVQTQKVDNDTPTPLKASEGAPEPVKKEVSSKYDQWHINYYEVTGHTAVLSDETYSRKCYICKKSFKTHLELQKFCSLECRNQFLSPVV